jgi:hypothetical protein
MIAPEIARALGAAHRSGTWWRARCPVHNSHGATLALRDGERGIIAICHAGCTRADIFSELRRRGLIGDAPACAGIYRSIGRPTENHDDSANRIALARRVWASAQDSRGSPVALYLAGRGITIGPPAALRWAPALRRPDGTNGPAMVARIDRFIRGP